MTFRKFVAEQVDRLTAFESFARLPGDGKKEFVNALVDRASESNPGRDRSALDWLDSISAQRVKAVINECLEFENAPSLADVRAVWLRLFPPMSELGKGCSRCSGSGFVEVPGPYGLSSAYPCTHQPETESDRRMGLRMTPTQAKRYMDEAHAANRSHVDWLKRREKSGDDKQFQRVTQSDVDALIDAAYAPRKEQV